MSYQVVTDLLTNGAYGTRSVKPPVLICIHITSNLGSAQNQRDYANRAGNTNGPSAHDYINPDGSVVHAIDTVHWGWSNGALNRPKLISLVNLVKGVVASGHNANQAYVREVECTGVEGTAPVTSAQLETIAEMVAHDSKATGIAISRTTVGQHSDLDTVNRPHCADLTEAQLSAVIARAKAILNPPPPVVVPPEVDVPILSSYIPGQIATIKAVSNIRSAPKLAAAVLRVAAAVESWAVTGFVVGDVDPADGSNLWLCRFAAGKWEYTSHANIASGPTDPTVALNAKVASLTAELSASETELAADEAKISKAKADLA